MAHIARIFCTASDSCLNHNDPSVELCYLVINTEHHRPNDYIFINFCIYQNSA